MFIVRSCVSETLFLLESFPPQGVHIVSWKQRMSSVVAGKMFEGTAETMLKSLDFLCQLPDDTLLWPGLLFTVF